jgi:hypothetical protein
MTVTISKLRLALAIAVVVLIAPTTALATHIFDDVPDGRFYSDFVEWASDNDITTGRTSTIFDPDAGVTRGESVTFLGRYDENVVQPATIGLFGSSTDLSGQTTAGRTPSRVGVFTTVTIPEGHTGVIEIGLTAESSCSGGAVQMFDWCEVTITVDGVPLGDATFAFDSSDDGTASRRSKESHAMTRVTGELPAGEYSVDVTMNVTDDNLRFELDEVVLTAEVHLMS